jgi:hypothetical protein
MLAGEAIPVPPAQLAFQLHRMGANVLLKI